MPAAGLVLCMAALLIDPERRRAVAIFGVSAQDVESPLAGSQPPRPTTCTPKVVNFQMPPTGQIVAVDT